MTTSFNFLDPFVHGNLTLQQESSEDNTVLQAETQAGHHFLDSLYSTPDPKDHVLWEFALSPQACQPIQEFDSFVETVVILCCEWNPPA